MKWLHNFQLSVINIADISNKTPNKKSNIHNKLLKYKISYLVKTNNSKTLLPNYPYVQTAYNYNKNLKKLNKINKHTNKI
jgi:hypothetical protein